MPCGYAGTSKPSVSNRDRGIDNPVAPVSTRASGTSTALTAPGRELALACGDKVANVLDSGGDGNLTHFDSSNHRTLLRLRDPPLHAGPAFTNPGA